MTVPFFVNEEDFPALTLASIFVPGTDDNFYVNDEIPGFTALAGGALALPGAALSMTIIDGAYKLPILVTAVTEYNRRLFALSCASATSSAHNHTYPVGSVIKPYLHAQAINEITRRGVANSGSRAVIFDTYEEYPYELSPTLGLDYTKDKMLTNVVNYYGELTHLTVEFSYAGIPQAWFVDGGNGGVDVHHTIFNNGGSPLPITSNITDGVQNIATVSFTIPPNKCAFMVFKACTVFAESLAQDVTCGTIEHTVG